FGIDHNVVITKLELAVHSGDGLYAVGRGHEGFSCILSGGTRLKVQQRNNIREIVAGAMGQLVKQQLPVSHRHLRSLTLHYQVYESYMQRFHDERNKNAGKEE